MRRTANATIEAIASGLEARRISGARPLTIMSQYNLPGNGGQRAAR
jgi:mannitol-1-phosphate/altronate dehydrogenase